MYVYLCVYMLIYKYTHTSLSLYIYINYIKYINSSSVYVCMFVWGYQSISSNNYTQAVINCD